MQGNCFDFDLQEWFEEKIPQTSIDPNYIYNILAEEKNQAIKAYHKVIWSGHPFQLHQIKKKANTFYILTVYLQHETVSLYPDSSHALWIEKILNECHFQNKNEKTFQKLQEEYKSEFNSALIDYTFMEELRNVGLLYI